MRKSVSDFHIQMKQYMTELTERIKRATTKSRLWIRKETRAPTLIWNVV